MENKEIEILKAEIERFKTEFRGTFIYENLLSTLTDDQIFDYLSIKNNRVIFNKHQTRQMWDLWQTAKATPEGFVLDAPARVGGGVFHEGVKWKTVIESAQRLYEYSKDEIKPIVSPADMLKIANGELVLVPKEATKEMIERGYEAHDCFFTLGSVRNVWDAMIEAQEQSHDSK